MSKSTDVTYEDIVEWRKTIKKSATVANTSNDVEKMRERLKVMCADMTFLVAFAESMLVIDIPQELYDRVRDEQRIIAMEGKENG